MSGVVLVERNGDVAVVTMNRPDSLNGLTRELMDELRAALEDVAGDPAVRCVVLTGAGRAFCAGGDIKGFVPARGEPREPEGGIAGRALTLSRGTRSSLLLHSMAKPTIAMVNGPAVGAGLSLALACDIRIASDRARLGAGFARVGYSGDFGGTWFLQRLVGASKAKELYFSSELLDAHAALALGMVTRVVPHDGLAAETMALAQRLAAGPTYQLGRIKDNFDFAATHGLAESLYHEAENMGRSRQTEDFAEAVRSFIEKRDPAFKGR